MTTDIKELPLLVVKAKASLFTLEYISQFEPSDIDSDDVDLRLEVDGRDTGTNVSIVDECAQAANIILALIEALEKAQRYIERLREWNAGLAQESCERQQRIDELESQRKLAFAASNRWADKFREAEQRIAELQESNEQVIHSRDHYKRVSEFLARRSAELQSRAETAESRVVSVVLPPRIDCSNVPFAAHTWNCCLDEVEKHLAAAGIQIQGGEK